MPTFAGKRCPFTISFLSDAYEYATAINEATKTNAGFRLTYIQDSTNC